MSTPFVVPKKSVDKHRETLQKKKCAFPGCKEVFLGTGKSKYCEEHRLRKYRKIIDAKKLEAKKAEEELNNPNQILNHKHENAVVVKMKCQLEGCNNHFEITMLPKIFVFPKFCENHRNFWKRKMFLMKNKESVKD